MAADRKNPRIQAYLTKPGGLATALGEARGRAGYSMKALADLLARFNAENKMWNSSKVSKLENGQWDPTDEILEQWAEVTDTPSADLERWKNLLEDYRRERPRLSRRALAGTTPSAEALESTARHIVCVSANVIPPLLQMPAYARALCLAEGRADAEYLAALMARQSIVGDDTKQLRFIIGESALRYAPNSTTVMPAQLDRLLSITDLDHVELGIIPQMTGLRHVPSGEGFAVYDQHDALMEGFLGTVAVADGRAEKLNEVATDLWAEVVEGEEARTIIMQAKSDFRGGRPRPRKSVENEHIPERATKPEPAPVVAAITVSERGVLVGRRNDGKPPWTFIAGQIEPGESPTDAVVREVKEETGLEVTAAEREIGRRVHPKTGRTMIYLACTPVGKLDVFVGDEDELAEVRWISLEEVDELLPGAFEPVLEYLRRELA